MNDIDGELYNIDFCNINELTFETMNVKHIPDIFWRWLPIVEIFIDAFLSRDFNSCLGKREALVVNEWLETKHIFHSLRGK